MVASDGEADADRCVRVHCGICDLWDARLPRTRDPIVCHDDRTEALRRKGGRDAEDRLVTPASRHFPRTFTNTAPPESPGAACASCGVAPFLRN